MTDRKAQYRQSKAKERQAKREAGLVPVEVWVPKDKAAYIRGEAWRVSDPDGYYANMVKQMIAHGCDEYIAVGAVANLRAHLEPLSKDTTTP